MVEKGDMEVRDVAQRVASREKRVRIAPALSEWDHCSGERTDANAIVKKSRLVANKNKTIKTFEH